MIQRVKMSTKDAEALRKRPVAAGKASKKTQPKPDEPQIAVRTKKVEIPPQSIRASSLRGVMEETMARVYGEIFSGMSTHDDNGIVDPEIKEEAYILSLTMLFGNDIDAPRQGLSLREDAKASLSMKMHKECE